MLYNNLTPGNGMNKKDLFLGFIIGIATTILGSYLFITFFTDFKFIADYWPPVDVGAISLCI